MPILDRKRKIVMAGDDIRVAGGANTYRHMTLMGDMTSGNLSEIGNKFYRECEGTCICHGVINKVFNSDEIFNQNIISLLDSGDTECDILSSVSS